MENTMVLIAIWVATVFAGTFIGAWYNPVYAKRRKDGIEMFKLRVYWRILYYRDRAREWWKERHCLHCHKLMLSGDYFHDGCGTLYFEEERRRNARKRKPYLERVKDEPAE